MKPNIIILTSGETGSSVLAGLISRAGYWLGDDLADVAYKTFENQDLINLNITILDGTDYNWHDSINLPAPNRKQIEQSITKEDKNRFKAFIELSEKNTPYLWKDPRLSYTIFYWKNFLNYENTRFILMTRDVKQTWIGSILRGKFPISLKDIEQVHKNCFYYSMDFLKHGNHDFIHVSFENLISNPEQTIDKLNQFLSTNLAIDDLRAIFRGKLHSIRWSKIDFIKAKLKFFYYQYISKDVIKFPRKR